MKYQYADILISHWYKPTLTWLTFTLWPFSILFRALAFLRRFFYQASIFSSTNLSVPVIVIGNINVGGTGKTPCIIALANYFKEQNYRVGIVSRGYGVTLQEPSVVTVTSAPSQVGDEPVLIARNTGCPVIVFAKRAQAAELLIKEFQCNLILSDDGLQHYALGRDIEIIVADGMRGFGNGQCLPAGPLREPIARIQKADFLLWNGQSQASKLLPATYNVKLENLGFFTVKNATPVELNPQKPIHAVAGIGNPNRFFQSLRDLGFTVIEHVFPDHYQFTAKDIQFKDDYKVVMTEKDAIKCKLLANERHCYLKIKINLPNDFLNALNARLKGKSL